MSGQRPPLPPEVLATLGVWPCSPGKRWSWRLREKGLFCGPSAARYVCEDGAVLGFLNSSQSGQRPPPALSLAPCHSPCPFHFKDWRQEVDVPPTPNLKQLEIHSLRTENCKTKIAGQLREMAGPHPDHRFLIIEVRRPP